jgi:hypothetical protein
MFNTSKTIHSAPSLDGKILLDVRQGQIFTINAVGAKILDLIDKGREESEIVDEIACGYNVSVDVARCDVRAFIGALHKHRIVRATTSIESANRG